MVFACRLLGASRRALLRPSAGILKPAWALPALQTRRNIMSSAARRANPGMPVQYLIQFDKPNWDPELELEYEVMPRDEFGVPAHIPPELSTSIRHTYYVPPQYYPFLKKLGDDTPALKGYMDKLINGEMTFDDYEEMFYQFSKPLKVYRQNIPMPYRTAEEVKRSEEIMWEGAWLSFRQRVHGDFVTRHYLRDFIAGMAIGTYFAWLYIETHKQYRLDMKLFYLEAPEHKINWVIPRGDL